MKRYKITTFSINTSRSILQDSRQGPIFDKLKEDIKNEIVAQFGSFNATEKMERYLALKPPVLSVVDEHTYLQRDIINAYIAGNFYPALTGACCLGERIFNTIIAKLKNDFKSSAWYKEVYDKDSTDKWDQAIKILHDWGIIDEGLKESYYRLMVLRNDSVHYQKKDQDASAMSFESISIVNEIIIKLFALDQNRKNILLYFDVPGEILIKKSAENDPLVRAFYIPCSTYVGPFYRIEPLNATNRHRLIDLQYEDKEISDDEFVKLRNEYTNRKESKI
ncbi:hypothetical protein HY604_04195 [Candidatus Peregrinibacteria bacterium]|nr:hypothetical protein [Candidatus Peregrinibacteria bacterium]